MINPELLDDGEVSKPKKKKNKRLYMTRTNQFRDLLQAAYEDSGMDFHELLRNHFKTLGQIFKDQEKIRRNNG